MRFSRPATIVMAIVSLLTVFPVTADGARFTFAVTADVRRFAGPSYPTSGHFLGACEAIASRDSVIFMVTPGDMEPPWDTRWTLDQVFGPDFLWYPVLGNHELDSLAYVEYIRAYDLDPNGAAEPNIVRTGPTNGVETTFSFDYDNAHFVVLNEYYDGVSDMGTVGDVTDSLYEWLAADLAANTKPHVFVFGHEPAYPQPDADNGRLRHEFDSLNQFPPNRDRFWSLLRDSGVIAYICGHTHNYSAYVREGVWQLDAAHARGLGDQGAPSTFLLITVDGDGVECETWRDVHDGIYDYDDIYNFIALRGTATTVTGAAPSVREFLLPNMPNPFNPATTLSYRLEKADTVVLGIHDLKGRLVRTLVRGRSAPGTHDVVWDGRDDAGHPVSGGVYFARIRAGDESDTRKIVLLR
ncbi:MAG: FlgD immunoglobulin-like domain containing protein [Candidatus Eisenbacteria bacterium]